MKFCTEEQDEEKIFNDSRDDFGIGIGIFYKKSSNQVIHIMI